MRIKGFDTLRVVAIILIVLYHADVRLMPGGFIGVSTFFVLSGWLLARHWSQSIYNERPLSAPSLAFSRIIGWLPALLALCVLCVAVAATSLPDLRIDLTRQIIAALTFTTNIYETLCGSGYEAQFLPHLLSHTWFLALLAQLTLTWIVVAGVVSLIANTLTAKLSKAKHADKSPYARATQLIIAALSLLGAGVSFYLAVDGLSHGADLSHLYYSPLTHGYPFMLGAGCGMAYDLVDRLLSSRMERPHKLWSALLVALALGGCCGLIARALTTSFQDAATFAWVLPEASLISLLIISALAELASHGVQFLPLPRFFASMVFPLYLFHWPLLVALRYWKPGAIGIVYAVCSSLALSAFWVGVQLLLKHLSSRPNFACKVIGSVGLLALVIAGLYWLQPITPALSQLQQSLWADSASQTGETLRRSYQTAFEQHAREHAQQEIQLREQQQIPDGVTVIGDSVTTGVRKKLLAHWEGIGVDVLAEGNRKLAEGLPIIQDLAEQHRLRATIVLCLGTNSLGDYEAHVRDFIEGVPPGHRVVIMTPNGGPTGVQADGITQFEREYIPTIPYAVLADWNQYVKDNYELFAYSDGIHFAGNEILEDAYINCLQAAYDHVLTLPQKTAN